MNKKSTYFLKTAFSFILSFIIFSIYAQTPEVKEALIKADGLYAEQKFIEARTLYLQNTVYLKPEQQYMLGIALLKKPESNTEAFKWIMKSADAGYTKGMIALSQLYKAGIGTAKDSVQHFKWVMKSADLGNNDALIYLGALYEIGAEVKIDLKKATEFYTKAYNNGSMMAAYFLGKMQLKEGSTSNALYWYKKAAYGEYKPAMFQLGDMYEKGTGMTSKNLDEAVRWYMKIDKMKGYDNYQSAAIKRIQHIGAAEPSTDINTVKPLIYKLLSGAATNFEGLMGEEKEPFERQRLNPFVTKTTYYTCTVDAGFKNALIKKEDGYYFTKVNGTTTTQQGTEYRYDADIVHYQSNQIAKRIFEQWVTLVKKLLPGWQGTLNSESAERPYFKISGKMGNGKTVTVGLSVYGYNANSLSISIAAER